VHEVKLVSDQVGWFGLMALLLKAYSMGAGTYTGIEAVSNGLPILREPRVKTGRRTMVYMGTSLAITVAGLLLAYLLYRVTPVEGKTLNAVLFESMTSGWSHQSSRVFILVTLASEAALLLIAAQAGFLDGPRVLANMALDRFVSQNGILMMGGSAFLMLLVTRGSVELLVVLYSINVFITFSLSQLGMVRHWWNQRRVERTWLSKLAINGFGLALTTFILISLTVVKFFEGGWATLLVTGVLVAAAFGIKRHYRNVGKQLRRLDGIVEAVDMETTSRPLHSAELNTKARTAIVLVNGYNGLGLHTLLQVPRVFGDTFRNFVFIEVGTVDAGNFKGAADIEALRTHTEEEVARYVRWAHAHNYGSKAYTGIGNDVTSIVMKIAKNAAEEFPNHVFFAGQLSFANETYLTRWLHNHTVFILQRRFFLANLPFVILPIRIAG